MYVVGLLELAGATLILIPAVARYGFGILIFVMCGAIVTHVMSGEIAIAGRARVSGTSVEPFQSSAST